MDANTKENLIADYQQALADTNISFARQKAQKLLDLEPDSPDGYVLLANCGLHEKSYDDVIEFLLNVVEKFPNEARCHYILALAYGGIYRHGKSTPHLERAVELKPDWVEAQFLLGQSLFKSSGADESIPYLRFAVERLPNDFRANFLLGCALQIVGDYNEAAKHMARAHALVPQDTMAKQQHEELQEIIKSPPRKGTFVRYPRRVEEFFDFSGIVKTDLLNNYRTNGFTIRTGMKVLTQGSCFAGNLAKSFRRYKLKVLNMDCGEEHNSTFANTVVMRWLTEGVIDEGTEIVDENLGSESRERYREFFKSADLYVYTMGVAPVFFNKETGIFNMPKATGTSKAALVRKCDFRTTTVQENVNNLREIISAVRSFNSDTKIVITVSPVPLSATSEMNSAIMADCISKSTLRIAAHEVMQEKIANVFYWPSFEMVRWVGGHYGQVFGTDDGSTSHPNFEIIDAIIDSFIDVFGDDDLRAAKAA